MGEVRASVTRELEAEPQAVFGFISDYRQRPAILTDNFHDYQVELGGVGPGTVVAYGFRTGRRDRDYRVRVDAPEPGRALREVDERSSFRTVWTVVPREGGRGSEVTIESSWQGAGGIGGFFERTFAPTA